VKLVERELGLEKPCEEQFSGRISNYIN